MPTSWERGVFVEHTLASPQLCDFTSSPTEGCDFASSPMERGVTSLPLLQRGVFVEHTLAYPQLCDFASSPTEGCDFASSPMERGVTSLPLLWRGVWGRSRLHIPCRFHHKSSLNRITAHLSHRRLKHRIHLRINQILISIAFRIQ